MFIRHHWVPGTVVTMKNRVPASGSSGRKRQLNERRQPNMSSALTEEIQGSEGSIMREGLCPNSGYPQSRPWGKNVRANRFGGGDPGSASRGGKSHREHMLIKGMVTSALSAVGAWGSAPGTLRRTTPNTAQSCLARGEKLGCLFAPPPPPWVESSSWAVGSLAPWPIPRKVHANAGL